MDTVDHLVKEAIRKQKGANCFMFVNSGVTYKSFRCSFTKCFSSSPNIWLWELWVNTCCLGLSFIKSTNIGDFRNLLSFVLYPEQLLRYSVAAILKPSTFIITTKHIKLNTEKHAVVKPRLWNRVEALLYQPGHNSVWLQSTTANYKHYLMSTPAVAIQKIHCETIIATYIAL